MKRISGIPLFALIVFSSLSAQGGTGWIPTGRVSWDPNSAMECSGLRNPHKTLLDTMLFVRATEIDDLTMRHKVLSGYASLAENSESDLRVFLKRMDSDFRLPMNVSDSGGLWSLVEAYVAKPLPPADIKVTCKTVPVHAYDIYSIGIQRIIFPVFPTKQEEGTEQLIIDETYVCLASCKRAAVSVTHRVDGKYARTETGMSSGNIWDFGFWPPHVPFHYGLYQPPDRSKVP